MAFRGKLTDLRERARESIWPVPAGMVLLAVLLALATLWLDRSLEGRDIGDVRLLFGGSGEGAREILGTIAGSLITVVSIAFSVIMVALQQAASRYSPRVLQQFTRDRGNKIVLGTYIATFTYALVVLTQVRGEYEEGARFVPTISIAVAMLLALVSLGMLIYFIHHSSQTLQVEQILSAIRWETLPEIERHFPRTFGEPREDPAPSVELLRGCLDGRRLDEVLVCAPREGYLRLIDEEALSSAVPAAARVAWVPVRIGQYVHRHQVLLRAFVEKQVDDEPWRARAAEAFELGQLRSLAQDPLYGVRQIVDIAVKALSSGINDPTTAEQALDQVGALLIALADRDLPSPVRETERGTIFVFDRPSFAEYVERSFGQIRQNASSVHVQRYMLGVIATVGSIVRGRGRLDALRQQVDHVLTVDRCDGAPREQQALRERAAEVKRVLAERQRAGAGANRESGWTAQSQAVVPGHLAPA